MLSGSRVWLALMCLVLLCLVGPSCSWAQFSVPGPAAAPSPDALFRNQCGTCHTLSAAEPLRQGPPLGGVFGRKAGSVVGFKYSAGFAKADFTWDAQHLDAWLTHPQAVIPGAVMGYRQANPATRKAIIDWLKEQH
jgi:cytochrome c